MQHEFRADLHCHTICSDGTKAPSEVLHLAKIVNLQGLSITDHDTISAYTPELFELANELQLRLLPGVEISSELDEMTVHILGYGFDLNDTGLQNFLSLMQKRREERNRAILQKLALQKMPISEEELKAFATHRTIGRPHIAQIMVNKGYVPSLRSAFENYLKEGALCYASGMKYSPIEVIEEIHKSKGKAILAHPHFYKRGVFLRKLLDFPFDGYECYYSMLDKTLERPWLELAKERGLIATGGSDYHGSFKPHIALGCSWVNLHTFEQLIGRRDDGRNYETQ